MCQDVGSRKTCPEGPGAERPGLRVSAEQNEDGKTAKGKRPEARPSHTRDAAQEGEHSSKQYDQARPMVVILRPLSIHGIAGAHCVELCLAYRRFHRSGRSKLRSAWALH